jgi:hypothetical protein
MEDQWVLYTETLAGPPQACVHSPGHGTLHVNAGAWSAKPSECAQEHCDQREYGASHNAMRSLRTWRPAVVPAYA